MEDLVSELSRCPRHLGEAGSDLFAWLLIRFQVENVKVLLRGFMDHTPLEAVQEHLVTLPEDGALDARTLMAAETLQKFVQRLPMGTPRQTLRAALGIYRDHLRPFFLEAALDRGYFQDLLARAGRLSGEDKELVAPIVDQEVNMFQLMLAARGRFNYGLTPELLLPLHIRWCGIPADRFKAMLAAPDIRAAAVLALGRAIDSLPSEPESTENSLGLDFAELEALTWIRFLRLANQAFRRSHMGFGAVIGYVGIRRVEVANLITLSEGIRTGVLPEVIRARLIPRRVLEVDHV